MLWSALAVFAIYFLCIIILIIYDSIKEKKGEDTKAFQGKIFEIFSNVMSGTVLLLLLIAGGIEITENYILPNSKEFVIISISLSAVLLLAAVYYYIFKLKKTAYSILGFSIVIGLAISFYYLFIEFAVPALRQLGEWLAKFLAGFLIFAVALLLIAAIIFLSQFIWKSIYKK